MYEKILEQEIKSIAGKVLARVRDLSTNVRETSPNAESGTKPRIPKSVNPRLLLALRDRQRVQGMITGQNLDIKA